MGKDPERSPPAAPLGASPEVQTSAPEPSVVSAWPALALVGSYELLMMLIRAGSETSERHAYGEDESRAEPIAELDVPPVSVKAPTLEQTVQAWHDAGRSQRAIARELSIDRRKVKQIIDQAA